MMQGILNMWSFVHVDILDPEESGFRIRSLIAGRLTSLLLRLPVLQTAPHPHGHHLRVAVVVLDDERVVLHETQGQKRIYTSFKCDLQGHHGCSRALNKTILFIKLKGHKSNSVPSSDQLKDENKQQSNRNKTDMTFS